MSNAFKSLSEFEDQSEMNYYKDYGIKKLKQKFTKMNSRNRSSCFGESKSDLNSEDDTLTAVDEYGIAPDKSIYFEDSAEC